MRFAMLSTGGELQQEESPMQVELLYHTPDPERAIATAARLCYAPVGASELMETMPEDIGGPPL